MSKKLMVGPLVAFVGVALASACGSSSGNGGSSGGAGGTAGSATGGSGGSTAGSGGIDGGGPVDGSGGDPFADVTLDAPYQLPDGGCGQVFCPAAVAAACQNGFASLNDCATFCGNIAQSPCAKEWNTLLTCAGPNPNITCNATSGLFEVTGCSQEEQAFVGCAFADGG